MAELISKEYDEETQAKSNFSIINNNMNIILSKEFLTKLQVNAYHEMLNEDVVDHIAKVIKMLDLINIPSMDSHQLRMKDHIPTCLSHMIYCIATSTKYNLAFFIAKRIELVTKQAQLILPYDTKELWHEKRSSFYFCFLLIHFRSPIILSSDDDNDEENEGTSHVSTPSPTQYVNSLSNDVPQVFSNPPHDDPNMEAFFTRQTKILKRQVQQRDEHWSGLRSIGKGIKNLLKGKKK
ncbi:hypothetical protein Tco_1169764 [Tanacetum coccineum]